MSHFQFLYSFYIFSFFFSETATHTTSRQGNSSLPLPSGKLEMNISKYPILHYYRTLRFQNKLVYQAYPLFSPQCLSSVWHNCIGDLTKFLSTLFKQYYLLELMTSCIQTVTSVFKRMQRWDDDINSRVVSLVVSYLKIFYQIH
jgi:hypothetical protein